MDDANDNEPVSEVVTAEVVGGDDLLRIESNGAPGADGRNGRGYAGDSASHGHNGRSGEDATRPRAGEGGGFIEVILRPAGANEQLVEVSGRRGETARDARLIRETVPIGDRGLIRLVARGGKGGDGGRGGDGEAGGRGYDGTDATRFSHGTDGGPGGDGGDGGNGTSGADGGRGGHIVIEVEQRDTHLLMLALGDTSGGEGGAPGSNGRGGEGGRGGDGGSSHSWTTTSTEHYTDAQGERRSRMVTHHHRNRGGSDGSSGHRGRDGTALLSPGRRGDDGEVRIVVRSGREVRQYLHRYEVEIVDYQLVLTDQFAEPGSGITIAELTVRNTGGMPTPERCPVEVMLAASRWVQPAPGVLRLPRVLEPNESYTFDDEQLRATVADVEAVPEGEPLRETDHVNPLARQTGAERVYANQHPRQEFTVAFPSELEPIESLESQTPGQAALFVVSVTNRSQRVLGRHATDPRTLAVRVTLDNDELAAHVMLLDMDAKQIAWESGYDQQIDRLEPGQTWSRQLILGVLPGAPGYRKAVVKVALQLGRVEAPQEARDCHHRLYPVRIAQAYEYDPNADILLIVHHGTTTEELAAWRQLAARLDQTISVWDISLNDSLSLSEQLAHGRSLLRDFHGRTIVVSNAPFHTALGTRHGDEFLSQMDLIKAAASHDIRLLLINDQQRDLAHLFQERLVPTDGEPEYRYDSLRALQRSAPLDDVDVLFEQVDELIAHGARAARPDPMRQTSEVDLYGVFSPSERRLRKEAERLQRRMQEESPGRRSVVMYRLPSELTAEETQRHGDEPARSGFFFTHVHQGTLSVMPTLGDDHPNLIVLNAAAEQIHEPAFVLGEQVTAALVQALSFQERLFLLGDRLRSIGEQWRINPQAVDSGQVTMARFLVDAILTDLACEQASILKSGWCGLFSRKLVTDALTQLHMLAQHPFLLVTGDADQPDVQVATRLIAGLTFLGQLSSRWYESRVFPWSWWRRGPVLRRAVLDYRDALTKNLLGRPAAGVVQAIDSCVQEYCERLRETRRQTRVDKRSAARQVVSESLSRHGIVTDSGRAFPAVLSYQQWLEIRNAETRREEARLALRRRKEENRAAYGVARDGKPLSGVDPRVQHALQPFTAACAAVQAELAQRTRRPRNAREMPQEVVGNHSDSQESQEQRDSQEPIREQQ